MDQKPYSYLKSQYIGLHSSRFQNVFITSEPSPSLYHPIGGHIVKRDALTLQELYRFQAHNNSIVVTLPIPPDSPDKLTTMAYCGEIKLFSLSGTLLSSAICSERIVRHGCVNNQGNLVAASSVFGVYNGIIDVWRINENFSFEKILTIRGNYKLCEFSHLNSLFALRENTPDEHRGPCLRQRDMPIPEDLACTDFHSDSDSEDPIDDIMETMRQRHQRKFIYYGCLFQRIEGDRNSLSITLPNFSRINSIITNRKGQIAVGYLCRTIAIIDMETLEILHMFKVTGAGSMLCLEFIDNFCYFSPNSGIYTKFDINQEKVLGEIDLNFVNPAFQTVKTGIQWINKTCAYLRWIIQDSVLVGLNEYGIFLWNFKDFPNSSEITKELKLEFFKITCCGLEINPIEDLIAVGDFVGNIKVFDTKTYQLVYERQIPSGIRCLSWDINGKEIYLGGLDGHLYKVNGETENYDQIWNLQSDVICMSWKQGLIKDYLAAGTKNGELWILSKAADSNMSVDTSFIAHDKQSDSEDVNFGSLKYFSEIWTLAWSPDSGLIATGSEDQTVNIWDWTSKNMIIALPKHSKAVTGVRWLPISATSIKNAEICELFLTSSDDQTMRIYDPKTWTLLHIFTTNFIREWHTITYAAIEENGKRVACVTQNGYLMIFHLETLENGFYGRIHNGSVEGLDWRNGKLATCASECLICIIDTN
ncbi:unnamed protein product [Blepharisma stoltei]|uniref:Anaphase-promoting complex subunit 4-like WD40 domain-containing protein n=1 Tax=Blepharisma stoltei TaxID=1481888 RepID=A0AAU9ILI2_9CILI|nr:unnamed protein product [Blepharisma stoltei]